MEEWRAVVGYEGLYEVSSEGRVKTLLGRYKDVLYMKPTMRAKDYPAVGLKKNKKSTTKSIHALMLEAFVGPRPHGFHGCHNDGNPSNNTIENLRWDSVSNNTHDRIKHGRFISPGKVFHRVGESHHSTNLTVEDVRRIREARLYDASGVDLANAYGIKHSSIYRICNRHSWKHV